MSRFNRRIPRRYLLPLRILVFGLLALVVIPGTWALATATIDNAANQAALTALYYPTAAAGVGSGHAQSITWTLPAANNGNGFGIMALKQGPGTTCPTTLASYEPAAVNWVSSVSNATVTYTDSGAVYGYDANYEGGVVCYLIHSGFKPGSPAPGWAVMPGSTGNVGWESLQAPPNAATAPASAIAQSVMGFVVTSVTSSNGGVAGKLDVGDKFVFNYNQPVDTTTVNLAGSSLCVTNSFGGAIGFGDTRAAGTNCSFTPILGYVLGQAGSTNAFGAHDRWPIAAVWSNGNKTLTLTLGAGLADTMTGNWQFTPNAATMSANGAPKVAICTAAAPTNGLCIVTTTVAV